MGTFSGSVDFGGGALESANSPDVFVASYDASGAYRWSRHFGNLFPDRVEAVAADALGHVAVVGSFVADLTIGSYNLSARGQRDIFLVSFDSAGALRWVQHFGGPGWDYALGVAFDRGSAALTITGKFQDSVDFGGGALTASGTFGDGFVANYDSAGGHRWSSHFHGTASSRGDGVVVDACGNITVAGSFDGSADFGGGPLTSAGLNAAFLAGYDPNGDYRWAAHFGGEAWAQAYDVAVGRGGVISLVGSFQGAADFGGGTMSSVADSRDGIILQLGPEETQP